MNLVLNNPFRILGLLITASEREIAKRISDLSIFAEMGKIKSYDTDFSFLSTLERNPESVKEASARIEQPEGKLFCSLFWFWKHGVIDELAFNMLKNGEVGKAISLWTKYISGKNISEENYSAIKNLSVLYLGLAGSNLFLHSGQDFFLKGITLAGIFFGSPLFEGYCRIVSGINYTADKEKIGTAFADEIIAFAEKYLDKPDSIGIREILESFRSFPHQIFPYLSGKFINEPTRRIESEIEKARKTRTDSPYDAYQQGEELYQNSLNDLAYLKKNLPASDLQYQMIADRLANEILQCAIDYFNAVAKHAVNHASGEKSLKLAKIAMTAAAGERVISRIEENTFVMETWIKSSPQRQRHREIQLLIDDIMERINDSSRAPQRNDLQFAQYLLDNTVHKLLIIKASVGADNPVYLNAGSAVADKVSELCMRHAAQTGEYASAANTMQNISMLDMMPEIREKYNKINVRLQAKRENEIHAVNLSSSDLSENDLSEKKGKCYIATMVYGDYDSPEVLRLRNFRDRVLICSGFGRLFIRFYYRYSPIFVAKFGRMEWAKNVIRFFLNLLFCISAQRTPPCAPLKGGFPTIPPLKGAGGCFRQRRRAWERDNLKQGSKK
ncbi:MAG: hypothetical protein BWK80_45430 [Desulfobacteraceae bacterium IS3]|nr:MAG: hypothetical protein BWK80_45430 [Desulfobacteraceae bacterium IS3]